MIPAERASLPPHERLDAIDAPGPRSLRSRAWRFVPLAGLLALVALALRFGADAGVIWDDEFHFIYGEAVLRWFRSGFTDQLALSYGNLYLYGGLFDLAAQLVVPASPLGLFETRHVVIALVAILGVVATWRTAAELGGARAGLLAALLLVLTPAWTGHALMNPKDIPFAALAAWAVYGATRAALAPPPVPLRIALLAGIGAGAAMAVRPGGMFVLGYLVIAVIGRAWIARGRSELPLSPEHRRATLVATAARLGIALALAWGLMIATWPWAQLSPLLRPFQSAAEASQFLWRRQVLFDGAWEWSTSLPARYLPTWFAVTMPGTWAVALACGAGVAVSAFRRGRLARERVLAVGVVAVAAVLPLVGAVVLRPVLYDAHRHFLFVLPPAAALGGFALSSFLDAPLFPRWLRAAALAILAVLALATARDMVRLHPYEYVYFNRLAGGLAGAAGRYETDYWGASYREGVEWLVENVSPPPDRPLRVAGCSAGFQVGYYLQTWSAARGRFVPVDRDERPDVLLATTRWNCHLTPGDVMHVVTREGVPLLYVIRPVAR